MKIKGVFFDFDMTLADSSYAITECVNELAKVAKLKEVSREEIFKSIGLPIEKAWTSLWGYFDPQWVEIYRNNFRDLEMSLIKLFPNSKSTLEAVRGMGLVTGLVSNRRFAARSADMAGLSGYMDVIVGLEDVSNPKPHPESLLCALNKMGLTPDEAVYVGDTDIDMQTAKNAGVRGIGVTTGNTSREGLFEAGAAWVIDDIAQVTDILSSLDNHKEVIS